MKKLPEEAEMIKMNYENLHHIKIKEATNKEQEEAEQKLKESEEKYRLLFENMVTGFAYHKVLVDENNKPIDYSFIEANPAFKSITGTWPMGLS